MNDDAMKQLCGSEAWCRAMNQRSPFDSAEQMHRAADECFGSLTRADWIEAFQCHPKIGDINSLRMKFAGNVKWSHGEQSGIGQADDSVLEALAAGNTAYESRFGYIFIVCATGKTAAEMLKLLNERMVNDPELEWKVAAAEQAKITHLRIDKL